MIKISKNKLKIYMAAAFAAGIVISVIAALLIFKGAFGFVAVSSAKYEAMSDTYEKFGKLDQLYQSIDKYYYKEIDEDALLEGAEKGLVAGLEDPYSAYMTKEEYDSWKASATGEYSGVGVTFSQDEKGNFIVVEVSSDSPAEKAGIKTGDKILEVDGKSYEDMELMANSIRGEEGSKVTVKYSRNGTEKEVTMTREEIVQKSVEYKMLDNDIGYIKLTSFISSSYDDFKAALEALQKDGAKGLVLDLRDNGGGLVDTCIDIADEFLDEGVVTYVEDKEGKRTDYEAKDGKTSLKIVVLTNENSASCSEILAAALQDNGYEIVGEKTFGKGVIQSTMELKDGSALKLTIMQYFSPDGKEIQDKGVSPDHEIKDDENTSTDEQLEEALSLF